MHTHGNRQTGQPATTRSRFRRIIWPGGLLAMIGALVCVDVTMLVISSGDPSFAVVEVDGDPSEAWNRSAQQRAASERLGWNAELAVAPADAAEADLGTLRVVLTDRDQEPLRGMDLEATGYHLARAADRQQLLFTAVEGIPGAYEASIDLNRAGIWRFELVGVRAGQRFQTRIDRMIQSQDAGRVAS